MKVLGRLAIIFACIFLVSAVAGCICAAIGLGSAFMQSDALDRIEEEFNNLESHFDSDDNDLDFNETNWDASVSWPSENAQDFPVIKAVDVVGKISLKMGSTDECTVSYEGSTSDVWAEFVAEEDCLTIEFHYSDMSIFDSIRNAIKAGSVEIILPCDFSGEFILENSVGEINADINGLSGLTLMDTMGDVNAQRCGFDVLTVTNATGDFDIIGELKRVKITDAIGNFDIESSIAFEGISEISDCTGDFDIELPLGSNVNLTSSDMVGTATVVGLNDPKAANAAEFFVSDIIGEVIVEIDDN